jgi:hypothetical protein
VIAGNDLEGNFAIDSGAAILSRGNDSRIEGNILFKNRFGYYGGGIWCSGDRTRIAGNIIEQNGLTGGFTFSVRGGGIYAEGDDVEIVSNGLYANYSESFTISCTGARARIADCVIANNTYGSGIHCQGDAAILRTVVSSTWGVDTPAVLIDGGFGGMIDRCKIVNNQTDYGVGGMRFSNGCDALVTGTLISGNVNVYAGFGGGIDVEDATVQIIGCTITQNVVDSFQLGSLGGGGIHFSPMAQGCSIENSIVWGNLNLAPGSAAPEIFDGSPDLVVSWSNVGGGWAGTGNQNLDPQFVSPGTSPPDFSLSSGSPCIDAGDATFLSLDVDLDGAPRLLDGDLDGTLVIDQGALEFGHVGLDLSGVPSPGQTLTFHVDAPAGWLGLLFVSRFPGLALAPPFGPLFFDPAQVFLFPFGVFLVPADLDLGIPSSFAGPATFVVQAVGVDLATWRGNVSQAVEVAIP